MNVLFLPVFVLLFPFFYGFLNYFHLSTLNLCLKRCRESKTWTGLLFSSSAHQICAVSIYSSGRSLEMKGWLTIEKVTRLEQIKAALTKHIRHLFVVHSVRTPISQSLKVLHHSYSWRLLDIGRPEVKSRFPKHLGCD